MNNKILSRYSSQPLHETLKDFRVVPISSITFIMWLLSDMWHFYKTKYALSPTMDEIAFLTFAGSVVGIFWKATHNIMSSSPKDSD